jgi:hypothetical protein
LKKPFHTKCFTSGERHWPNILWEWRAGRSHFTISLVGDEFFLISSKMHTPTRTLCTSHGWTFSLIHMPRPEPPRNHIEPPEVTMTGTKMDLFLNRKERGMQKGKEQSSRLSNNSVPLKEPIVQSWTFSSELARCPA